MNELSKARVFFNFSKFKEVTLAAADATRIAIAISFVVDVILTYSYGTEEGFPRVRFFHFNFDVAK